MLSKPVVGMIHCVPSSSAKRHAVSIDSFKRQWIKDNSYLISVSRTWILGTGLLTPLSQSPTSGSPPKGYLRGSPRSLGNWERALQVGRSMCPVIPIFREQTEMGPEPWREYLPCPSDPTWQKRRTVDLIGGRVGKFSE